MLSLHVQPGRLFREIILLGKLAVVQELDLLDLLENRSYCIGKRLAFGFDRTVGTINDAEICLVCTVVLGLRYKDHDLLDISMVFAEVLYRLLDLKKFRRFRGILDYDPLHSRNIGAAL